MLLTSGPSTLDSPIRKGLQRHADLYFVLLLVSTVFVAIGIFFEWPEVRDGFAEWWRLRPSQTSWLVSPQRRSRLPVWALIGFILVSGGVAAEGVFEGLVGIEDTKIRNFDKGAIDDAELKTAQLQQSTQQLKTEADEARRQAEGERLERVKLERQVQPRQLSASQEKAIADPLQPYAGKIVSIASYSRDVEAMMLGYQIADALGKAHITFRDRLGTFTPMGRPIYIGVVVDASSSDHKLAAAIFTALRAQDPLRPTTNVVVQFGEGSQMYLPGVPPGSRPEDAFIFVGEKPLTEAITSAVSKQPKQITPGNKPHWNMVQ